MFKIGDLAREARVPVTTVRYYERAGLLQPSRRSNANYRLYDAAQLKRLKFIRTAQAAGFTLADVHILLDIREGKASPCCEANPVIAERLKDIRKRIEELEVARKAMERFAEMCRGEGGGSASIVIADIERQSED